MNDKHETISEPDQITNRQLLKKTNRLAIATLTQSVALAGVVVFLFKLTY
jgi:hypothetical protein